MSRSYRHPEMAILIDLISVYQPKDMKFTVCSLKTGRFFWSVVPFSFVSQPMAGLFRTVKAIKDKARHRFLADVVVLILKFIILRRFNISTQGGPFPDHNGHQGQSPPRILPMLSCSWNILFFVDLIPQPRAGLFRTIKVIKDKARPGSWIQVDWR